MVNRFNRGMFKIVHIQLLPVPRFMMHEMI